MILPAIAAMILYLALESWMEHRRQVEVRRKFEEQYRQQYESGQMGEATRRMLGLPPPPQK
jgi:hypothetical protein